MIQPKLRIVLFMSLQVCLTLVFERKNNSLALDTWSSADGLWSQAHNELINDISNSEPIAQFLQI